MVTFDKHSKAANLKMRRHKLTRLLDNYREQGYDIAFSCDGWSVFHNNTLLGGQGKATTRRGRSIEEFAAYNRNIWQVLVAIELHKLDQSTD